MNLTRVVASLARGVVMSLALVGAAAQAQQVLRVTAIPDESPTELARKFAPLGQYLESKLGMKVEWTPVTDYAAAVETAFGVLMRLPHRLEAERERDHRLAAFLDDPIKLFVPARFLRGGLLVTVVVLLAQEIVGLDEEEGSDA